jgi:hypothetical protein
MPKTKIKFQGVTAQSTKRISVKAGEKEREEGGEGERTRAYVACVLHDYLGLGRGAKHHEPLRRVGVEEQVDERPQGHENARRVHQNQRAEPLWVVRPKPRAPQRNVPLANVLHRKAAEVNHPQRPGQAEGVVAAGLNDLKRVIKSGFGVAVGRQLRPGMVRVNHHVLPPVNAHLGGKPDRERIF